MDFVTDNEDDTFVLRPLAHNYFGAEILGANLDCLSEEQVVEINEALLRFKVIIFRSQDNLTVEAQRNFSRKFGELHVHLQKLSHHPQYPDVSFVSNMADTPKFTGSRQSGEYHADLAWYESSLEY